MKVTRSWLWIAVQIIEELFGILANVGFAIGLLPQRLEKQVFQQSRVYPTHSQTEDYILLTNPR